MSLYKNFQGSIDDLIAHTSSPEAQKQIDDIQNDVNTILTDEEALDCIKEEYHCGDELAREIMMEIKLEEANRILGELAEKGLVEVLTYDENGKPESYRLTELGKQCRQQLIQNEKQNMDSDSQSS